MTFPSVERAGEQGSICERIAAHFQSLGISFSAEPLLDDADNRLEIQGTATARTAEEARRIVEEAKKMKLGIMPVGALSSANGSFKSSGVNDRVGWIGLKISDFGTISALPEPDEEAFDVIPILNGKARILKSKDPNKPHRVQAWAGVKPSELDEALAYELGAGHSVYLDLTTRDQAQIGAVVATGGQGPVRADASFNLHGLIVIDGEGRVRHLEGEDAKKQVGMGGVAGAITEVDFEVVREEPHEFGLFIPLRGNLQTGLTQGFPEIMARLAKFSRFVKEQTPDGPLMKGENGPLLIKGFEIVTRRDLHAAHQMLQARDAGSVAGNVGSMHQFMKENRCEVGLMVNFRTSLNRDQINEHLALLDEEAELSDEDDSVPSSIKRLQTSNVVHPDITGLIPFYTEHMPVFRQAREAVAIAARESKKEGPTKSTDLNLRLTATDPEDIKKAFACIWAAYSEYIEDAEARDAEIYIYGHNNPNGVDAHIRVTFPLTEQDHQRRAAENVYFLEGRLSSLYDTLIRMDGQHGIAVMPGEKGKLLSAEYTSHIEEFRPDEAEGFHKYIQEFGGDVFASRATERFRLHAYPPRLKEGILNHFAPDPAVSETVPLLERYGKAILMWCQNSHRSAEGQKVLCEVLGLIRDFLKLAFDERVFLLESPQEALDQAIKSLTDFQGGGRVFDFRNEREIGTAKSGNVQTVICCTAEQLDDPRFGNCKKILYLEHSNPVDESTRRKADAVIYSGKSFGTGADLGIYITSSQAIRHEKRIRKKGNNTGYVHSPVELNRLPHSSIETPPMQIIAELGCSLADRMGQTCGLDTETSAAMLENQASFVTFNPGPSQGHPSLLRRHREISQETRRLEQAEASARITAVEEVKRKLKKFLGVPDDYEIFFGGSATKAMEQIVQSLGLGHSIVLNMGAFGERQQTVVQRFSKKGSRRVRPVQMRWGTGPNSGLDATVGEIKTNQPRNLKATTCGLFMTGHDTSTGALTDISALRNKLHPDILTVVDGTSEIGAVERDFSKIDVYFGSVQKFFGLPSGLSVMICSPRALAQARRAKEERDWIATEPAPYRTFPDMEEEAKRGEFHNLRSVLQLGHVLDDFLARGGVRVIMRETRAKLTILEEVLADAETHFDNVVKRPEDRSTFMLHFGSRDIDMADLRARLPSEVGGGYGPYKNETMRLFLSPNIPLSAVQRFATAFREAIQNALSANPHRPRVAA